MNHESVLDELVMSVEVPQVIWARDTIVTPSDCLVLSEKAPCFVDPMHGVDNPLALNTKTMFSEEASDVTSTTIWAVLSICLEHDVKLGVRDSRVVAGDVVSAHVFIN